MISKKNMNELIVALIIFMFIVLQNHSGFVSENAQTQEEVKNNIPTPAISQVNAFNNNNDSIIVRIPINNDDVKNMTDLLTNLKQANLMQNVAGFIANSNGSDYIILSGSAVAVEKVQKGLRDIFGEQFGKERLLIDVHVSLREYSLNELKSIGINIMPYVNAQNSTYTYNKVNTNTIYSPDPNQQSSNETIITSTANVALNLESNLDLSQNEGTGKVLVGSNVITPSGVPVNLSSLDHSPIIIDTSGSLTTVDQIIETNIQVTPTIINLDQDRLEKSKVRIDLVLKISVPTGTVTVGNTQAMQYTEKNLTTNRIVTADNSMFIAGTFVSDVSQDTKNYIPLLGELPIIKYLFSNKTKQMQRKISILYMTVRILPEKPNDMPVSLQSSIGNLEGQIHKDILQ